jgi:catechol 2,3-dioxygenase-like lactoylglutathione lyase family enzyme
MITGLDHVALPMRDTDGMVAFYRALGFDVEEQQAIVRVHAGRQMINFHRPELWPREGFTLRAPAAVPPCGDLCFAWGDSVDALETALAATSVAVEEGPVERVGGRGEPGTSVYVRDPDGNLVEFIVYPRTEEP